jgi:large subunit ribosomal protein L9
MKVILQDSIKKLGKAGDVVEISPGYFRNFLEPRKLAVEATSGSLKKREEDLECMRRKAEEAHEAALAQAEEINALANIQIGAKAGDGGKLYGKVTSKDIAQALSAKLDKAVDKRDIKCALDINTLGVYKVELRLTSEVHAEFNVEVIAQN